jgi:autophagy-related protein 27
VISIAGALENAGGTAFDFEATRLKTSDSTSDSQKEGVRLILKGGKHPLSGDNKREQKAIIEFLCDKDRTGLEEEWESEDKYKKPSKRDEEKKEEDKEKEGDKEGDRKEEESTIEHQLKHNNTALIWDSYKDEKGVDVLRLTWHTKHACEKRDSGDDGKDGDDKKDPSAGWGFFTWFIIM